MSTVDLIRSLVGDEFLTIKKLRPRLVKARGVAVPHSTIHKNIMPLIHNGEFYAEAINNREYTFRRRREGDPPNHLVAPRMSHANVLPSVILEQLGRNGTTTDVLFQRVLDEYGTVHKRIFYGYLSRMCTEGLLLRSRVEMGNQCGWVFHWRRA